MNRPAEQGRAQLGERRRSRGLDRGIALVLVLVTFGVFGQTFDHGFVNFDDHEYVYENPRVTSGLSLENLAWAWTTGHSSNWHPLTWTSHMLDCQLFGVEPGAHHLVSVLLHAASALLLFAALRRLTGDRLPSAFVAFAFALHPLHVESVAWISERKDVLSGLFWMLTLLAYARYVERPSRPRFLAVFGALLLGVLSKPMVVTLPFVLLLLDLWPCRRLEQHSLGRLVREKLPLFALVAASSAVTFLVQRADEAVRTLHAFDVPTRIANALVGYVAYLRMTLWPSDLAVFYPLDPGTMPPAAWKVLGALALLGGITLWTYRARARRPQLLVGWLWFLGTLVPVIGLVQVGSQAHADRYTYLPLIGIFVMAAWGPGDRPREQPRMRAALLALGVFVLAVWSALAHQQVRHWRDSESLWSRALSVTANNPLAHKSYADELGRQGRHAEALEHYEAALAIYPGFVGALVERASTLGALNRREEAIELYRRALELEPDRAQIHVNLGNALAQSGSHDEAASHFERSLELDPSSWHAHSNLGSLRVLQGRYEEGIECYRAALELNPSFEDARANLERVLRHLGR